MTTTTQVSILIYDGLTALDAIGPYDVLRQVPDWQVEFVAKEAGEVRTGSGCLGLVADRGLTEAAAPDILLVPGGGSRQVMEDAETLDWIRAVDQGTRWTTSVCTGSLILAAAGLLDGRRATGHWLWLDPLRQFGAEPSTGRWVEDGKYMTAAGVAAGIDMALHLVDRELGPEVAQAIQLGIEYDPDPPFDTGHPEKAPAPIVDLVRATMEARNEAVTPPASASA